MSNTKLRDQIIPKLDSGLNFVPEKFLSRSFGTYAKKFVTKK